MGDCPRLVGQWKIIRWHGRFFASLRITASELVILSEAKNLDTALTHQIGTDSSFVITIIDKSFVLWHNIYVHSWGILSIG